YSLSFPSTTLFRSWPYTQRTQTAGIGYRRSQCRGGNAGHGRLNQRESDAQSGEKTSGVGHGVLLRAAAGPRPRRNCTPCPGQGLVEQRHGRFHLGGQVFLLLITGRIEPQSCEGGNLAPVQLGKGVLGPGD